MAGATVVFGSTAATYVTVISSTSMTAVSPAGTGTVDLIVTKEGGTSLAHVPDGFTYNPEIFAQPSMSGSVSLGSVYDLSYPQAFTVEIDSQTSQGWNLKVSVNADPTFGSDVLPATSINGSSSSSTSALVASCVSTCTLPTGNTVSYPLSVRVGSPQIVYDAATGTGIGPHNLAEEIWTKIPADSKVGTYTNTFTYTISNGP